jgi:hypothetical protein
VSGRRTEVGQGANKNPDQANKGSPDGAALAKIRLPIMSKDGLNITNTPKPVNSRFLRKCDRQEINWRGRARGHTLALASGCVSGPLGPCVDAIARNRSTIGRVPTLWSPEHRAQAGANRSQVRRRVHAVREKKLSPTLPRCVMPDITVSTYCHDWSCGFRAACRPNSRRTNY